jgi:hypothetical protein
VQSLRSPILRVKDLVFWRWVAFTRLLVLCGVFSGGLRLESSAAVSLRGLRNAKYWISAELQRWEVVNCATYETRF